MVPEGGVLECVGFGGRSWSSKGWGCLYQKYDDANCDENGVNYE